MLISLSLFGPMASAVLYFQLGRLLGSKLGHIMLALYVVSLTSCLLLAYNTITNDAVIVISLLKLSSVLGLNLEIAATSLSMIALSVILLISTAVNCYALYYMSADAMLNRFMGLLCAFTFSMSLLAISSNLITLFVGWELIGLYSFLLIGFWHDRTLANIASLKALFINKIGDVTLTVAMILLIVQLGSTELSLINTMYADQLTLHDSSLGLFLLICFIVAAAAKSAQVLLHNWLADAMQGPTPVSALLHAATLVVAGVVLLVKTASIINCSNITHLQVIGLSSAILGGLLALAQTDIKSTIAYSTLSQFGYIVSISSLATVSLAYFHVSTHACFKAALFMCAGCLIHASYDRQDLRSYGGLIGAMPMTYAAMLTCTGSLIAVPYLAGNVSKDLIIEAHASQHGNISQFVFVLSLLAAMLTVVYSIKLLIMAFWATNNSNKQHFEQVHEPSAYAYVPITILSVLAVILGWGLYVFAIDSQGLSDVIIKTELWSGSNIKLLPTIGLVLGLAVSITSYNRAKPLIISGINWLDKALYMRLCYDSLSAAVHYGYLRLGYVLANQIDLGLIELCQNNLIPAPFSEPTQLEVGLRKKGRFSPSQSMPRGERKD